MCYVLDLNVKKSLSVSPNCSHIKFIDTSPSPQCVCSCVPLQKKKKKTYLHSSFTTTSSKICSDVTANLNHTENNLRHRDK